MIVFYRMCSIESTSEAPILAGNKFKLNKLCLQSFIDAYKNIKPKIHFIMDYCGEDYDRLVREIVPFEMQTTHTQIGINKTCLMQYELFEKQSDDVVLFQECDYVYRKSLTPKMIEAFMFTSPYDHPDKYPDEETNEKTKVDRQLFKETSSTTSTFATTRRNFEAYKELFYKHGYIDKERWEEIGRQGGKLYNATPALATHMLRDWLAPIVDWHELWKKYL